MRNLGPMKIRHHGYSQRGDLPSITGPMLDVLRRLDQAWKLDEYWSDLDGVGYRAIKALLARTWIEESGREYKQYRITPDGQKALRVYDRKLNRRDGICPGCDKNERHITASGRRDSMCLDCQRARGKWRYHHETRDADKPCSRCKKHARRVFPNGKCSNYCTRCDKTMERHRRRQLSDTRLKQIQAGQFIKCSKSGCDQPIHYTQNRAYGICKAHWSESSHAKNLKQRQKKNATAPLSLPVDEIFKRVPYAGTIEHLPYVIKDGQRHFDLAQVKRFMRNDASWVKVCCDRHPHQRATVEMVCPEGYAIYSCPRCHRRFRIVLEFNYFLQENV